MKTLPLNKPKNFKKMSIGYCLFMHKLELNCRKKDLIRRYSSKINLTNSLIRKARKNIKYCAPGVLKAMNRETRFRNKLRYKLESKRMKKSLKKQRRLTKREEKTTEENKDEQAVKSQTPHRNIII
ncbi:uncharacterized protein LOC119675549 [Teleopsis dalmanni]|uniref:uncharacterized protein LOC119675549 n=1 Tax=Teleopsis dalmanni TaxID=139649 RepID=UPI0018CCDC11|nr:uncharacterized protein LOC119675549 [Teleopsis dalmanni]